jgi:hypothetical protein
MIASLNWKRKRVEMKIAALVNLMRPKEREN